MQSKPSVLLVWFLAGTVRTVYRSLKFSHPIPKQRPSVQGDSWPCAWRSGLHFFQILSCRSLLQPVGSHSNSPYTQRRTWHLFFALNWERECIRDRRRALFIPQLERPPHRERRHNSEYVQGNRPFCHLKVLLVPLHQLLPRNSNNACRNKDDWEPIWRRAKLTFPGWRIPFPTAVEFPTPSSQKYDPTKELP